MIKNISKVEEFLGKISRQPKPLGGSRPHFILIVPPSPQIPTPGREFLLRTPIEGASYISTTLKNAGYEVEIVDFRLERKSVGEIIKDDKIIFGIATFADSYTFLEDVIYNYARGKGLIKDEIEYFRSLSRRKVNYAEDEIVNCTELAEEKIREAFRKIRKISYERYGSLDWHFD